MVNRQPKGTPVGGQFAEGRKPEGGDLEASTNYGDVSNVKVGSRTPWGTADWVTHMAPGIVSVSTPGHGGVKLSPERNRKIPAPLRQASGWYEEDCEVYIPMMAFPEAFVRDGQTVEEVREFGKQGVIRWMPEDYEAATGTEIPLGVSESKDRRAWLAQHRDDEIAISAIGVDDGMVKVTVCRGGRGTNELQPDREILVPKDDYNNPEFRHPLGLHSGSFVVDPSKNYPDVTPPPKPPREPARRYRGLNTSKLSVVAQQRIETDLRKQFRFQDKGVHSVKEIIESGAITGKSYTDKGGGPRSYYLKMASEAQGQPATDSFYALDVSKALWDAFEAPSD